MVKLNLFSRFLEEKYNVIYFYNSLFEIVYPLK